MIAQQAAGPLRAGIHIQEDDGKHVLASHMGVLFGQYFIFVIITGNLIRWAALDPARAVALGGFLIAGWAALRRERWKTWGLEALEFEDDDPSEVNVLRI